jgi:hypothetical protein
VIEAIDSYFLYVKQQMSIVDSAQQFGGVVNAHDWPQMEPADGTLYLLYMNSFAMDEGTEAQNKFQHMCQWVWVLVGDDIAEDQQAMNRGSRWRQHMQIQHNLRQANFPSFCAKKQYTADAQTGVVTGTPYTQAIYGGAESVWWSMLRFMPRFDQMKSGLVYGAASVTLYSYDDVLTALL